MFKRKFAPTTKTHWVEIALGRMETHFPLQQSSLPPKAQKCAVLSIPVLMQHPWSKRRAAAAAAAAVALGVEISLHHFYLIWQQKHRVTRKMRF